jgi:hypothetical protein
MPSDVSFLRSITNDLMQAKKMDDSDESTSTLSLLLDELLSPSYTPDFPIPSRVELLGRRSTIKHSEPTSNPYGLLVIEDENLSFVPKIPQ